MSLYYMLDPVTHEITETDDLMLWAQQIENSIGRVVMQTRFDEVFVSTVFLGIDHSFSNYGPPVLFETMVFGGPLNEYQVRYCTWDEAVAGHAVAVRKATKAHTVLRRMWAKFLASRAGEIYEQFRYTIRRWFR